MSDKVLVSFLGNNVYVKANYYINDIEYKSSSPTFYIQSYLADVLNNQCKENCDNLKIRIFLTDEAYNSNYKRDCSNKNDNRAKTGYFSLLEELEKSGISQDQIECIHIPSGDSEKEIWEIFSEIYQSFGNDETAVFDITHSFRFMPMLFIVLIRYLNLLKGLSVEKIYYGAFETLGNPVKVKTEIEDPEDRTVPIYDITMFNNLLSWTEGVDDFINHGSFKKLEKIINSDIGDLFRTFDRSGEPKFLSNLNNCISKLSNNFVSNNGPEVLTGGSINWSEDDNSEKDYYIKIVNNIIKAEENINDLTSKKPELRPIVPLMEYLKDNINQFSDRSVKARVINTIEWCINHNQLGTAITMLPEFLITWVILESDDIPDKHIVNRDIREDIVKTPLIWKSIEKETRKIQNEKEEQFKNNVSKVLGYEDFSIHDFIANNPLIENFQDIYNSLSDLRNYYNHAGFNHYTEVNTKKRNVTSNMNYAKLLSKFNSNFNRLKELDL